MQRMRNHVCNIHWFSDRSFSFLIEWMIFLLFAHCLQLQFCAELQFSVPHFQISFFFLSTILKDFEYVDNTKYLEEDL